MGQTLSSATHWTSAKEGERGKLEFTPTNELILNKIIGFVEGFSSSQPDESRLIFKQPMTWLTELDPSDFNCRFSERDDQYVSDAVDKNGHPLVTLKKKGTKYNISVMSLEQMENVIIKSGSKKMTEARHCLEANRDPVALILGERFATVAKSDDAIYRFTEEIMKKPVKRANDDDGNGVDDDVEEKKIMLRLLLRLKDFDDKLMKEAVKTISSEVKLSPPDVERAFELLKRFSGEKEDKHILKEISWTEPYNVTDKSGCRAPFWRQMYGDLSYITVKPYDSEDVYITASTYGYFVNGGPNKTTNELDFEKYGAYYKDIVTLLREKSTHFATIIEKQDVFKVKESGHNDRLDVVSSDSFDGSRDDEYDRKTDKTHKQKADDRSKLDKKKKQEKRKFEPSLKWKALEVEEKGKKDEKHARLKTPKKGHRGSQKFALQSDGESSFDESSSESDEEEETMDRRLDAASDLPSEYWQIQKLVKYLKGGNQTATIIALCSMRDFSLSQETSQLAIRDVGGLEVLINLLETDEPKCKIGSLKILKEISKNVSIRRAIADLGGLQIMVKILRDPNKELRALAAETIANVAKFRRACRAVRQHGGIKNLVALLDCAPMGSVMTPAQQQDVEVARCGALALWSCSKSERNKLAMRHAGAIPLLARLLKSTHYNMLIPVVGTLQECASEPSYRLAIRTEGMIEGLIRNLKSDNPELQMHCASAIFKCAEEKETRDLIRKHGGLDPLVDIIDKTDNKDLLAAATGAIWKCAVSPENVVRFQALKTIDLLVGLLNNQPEEVLVNVVGALAELAKDPANRVTIRRANGIPPLVNLLTGTNQALLVNVTKAVGHCAKEPESMAIIDKLDGVRLLWSLLKNHNQDVQASAAWAICPCIENAKDAGEMVRSFVGGLELIVGLLKSDNKEVQASVCAAIANIASDEENLAVITDHGVVPLLAQLTPTTDDKLRRHLAEAIARCCNWGKNRVTFGREDAVRPLVKYFRSANTDVHGSTAKALHQLSRDPDNCIAMHEVGVVKPLLELIGSDDHALQEASAGCLLNIRRLALANEKAHSK